MRNRSTPLPGGPTDVDADATTAELLARYHRHLTPLAAAPVTSSPAPQLVDHALAALAVSEAIVEGLHRERWRVAVDALRLGASVAEVGAAMAGLDAVEVTVGLTTWADQQHREGLLTADEHAAVVALTVRA